MAFSIQLVLSNLLVASLVGGVAWFVGRCGRRAALAHVLWIVFFIKLVTPPIVKLPVLQLPANVFPALEASAFSEVTSAFIRWSSSNRTVDVWLTLIALWSIGASLIIGSGIVRFVRFRRLICREGVRDHDAESTVRQILCEESALRTRNRSTPQVWRVPVRVSPMLFGVGWRPIIVCPDQLWRVLADDERKAFLAHEAAHYCRRDHWVRWLEWMVTAVYWWFPGVHWARHQLERHEEACCDAWAVRRLNSPPRKYAEALLRVVDFISDHDVATPRLASAMQPTDSLEERIRSLMLHRGSDDATPSTKLLAGAACFALWLVHPVAQPRSDSGRNVVDASIPNTLTDHEIAFEPATQPTSAIDEVIPSLPESPTGFWNRSPKNRWANFSLTLPGAELLADVRSGISVRVEGRSSVQFRHDELTALAEIPSTGRIVIGDDAGNLRLWDFADSMPVSLIGRHPSGITSLAYHDACGLLSADRSGSVMRWNLQSGQVLATWTSQQHPWSQGGVQSIRLSNDGTSLAILQGRWYEARSGSVVHFVNSETLEVVQTLPVPCETAIVTAGADGAWLCVDWSGVIRELDSPHPILQISKERVSALVLAADNSSLKVQHKAD